MSNKYDIEDLISTAVSQKPAEFGQAFNDIIVDKLQSAISNYKQDIAQTMFNLTPQEQEETPEE